MGGNGGAARKTQPPPPRTPPNRTFRHLRVGSSERSTSGCTIDSNLARDRRMFRCFGPDASAVMKGRLISVSFSASSSRFAFSAASRSRCIAMRSLDTSTPDSFLNSATSHSTTVLSKSSPPSSVSPFVALTSNTPDEISRMDTSNVPPPRSYTATILPSPDLSRPYASAAAVGSLMMRFTSRPAMRPAS